MPYKESKQVVKLKKLTQSQKKELKEHSAKHSVPHMRAMRWDMMQGASFKEAHKIAKKKHGK
jgi:hypothetical protein